MGSLRSLRRKQRLEPVPIPKPTDEEVIKAVRLGTVKQLKALLERGANPNAMNEKSIPALHYAAYFGKVGKVKILVKYGADVNKKDCHRNTALEAARCSYVWTKIRKIATFLLDHGADANVQVSPSKWPDLATLW